MHHIKLTLGADASQKVVYVPVSLYNRINPSLSKDQRENYLKRLILVLKGKGVFPSSVYLIKDLKVDRDGATARISDLSSEQPGFRAVGALVAQINSQSLEADKLEWEELDFDPAQLKPPAPPMLASQSPIAVVPQIEEPKKELREVEREVSSSPVSAPVSPVKKKTQGLKVPASLSALNEAMSMTISEFGNMITAVRMQEAELKKTQPQVEVRNVELNNQAFYVNPDLALQWKDNLLEDLRRIADEQTKTFTVAVQKLKSSMEVVPPGKRIDPADFKRIFAAIRADFYEQSDSDGIHKTEYKKGLLTEIKKAYEKSVFEFPIKLSSNYSDFANYFNKAYPVYLAKLRKEKSMQAAKAVREYQARTMDDWLKLFKGEKTVIGRVFTEVQQYKEALKKNAEALVLLDKATAEKSKDLSRLLAEIKELEERAKKVEQYPLLQKKLEEHSQFLMMDYVGLLSKKEEKVRQGWNERYLKAVKNIYKKVEHTDLNWAAKLAADPDLARLIEEMEAYKARLAVVDNQVKKHEAALAAFDRSANSLRQSFSEIVKTLEEQEKTIKKAKPNVVMTERLSANLLTASYQNIISDKAKEEKKEWEARLAVIFNERREQVQAGGSSDWGTLLKEDERAKKLIAEVRAYKAKLKAMDEAISGSAPLVSAYEAVEKELQEANNRVKKILSWFAESRRQVMDDVVSSKLFKSAQLVLAKQLTLTGYQRDLRQIKSVSEANVILANLKEVTLPRIEEIYRKAQIERYEMSPAQVSAQAALLEQINKAVGNVTFWNQQVSSLGSSKVPDGIRMIREILAKPELSVEGKLIKIQGIAAKRLTSKGLLGEKPFMRRQATQDFYKLIKDMDIRQTGEMTRLVSKLSPFLARLPEQEEEEAPVNNRLQSPVVAKTSLFSQLEQADSKEEEETLLTKPNTHKSSRHG